MSTAKIFEYKGNVGIEIDMENGKFLNDPTEPMQLGCVIEASDVAISKEAKDIIKNARHSGGSFSELMLTKHAGEDAGSSVGILGFGKVHLGKNFELGRACTKSVIDDCVEIPNEVPAEYKEFIDTKEGND